MSWKQSLDLKKSPWEGVAEEVKVWTQPTMVGHLQSREEEAAEVAVVADEQKRVTMDREAEEVEAEVEAVEVAEVEGRKKLEFPEL